MVCTKAGARETGRLWSASAFAATQCTTTRTPTLGPLKKADDAFRICNVLPPNPRPRRPLAELLQQTSPLYRLSDNLLSLCFVFLCYLRQRCAYLMVVLIVPEFVVSHRVINLRLTYLIFHTLRGVDNPLPSPGATTLLPST